MSDMFFQQEWERLRPVHLPASERIVWTDGFSACERIAADRIAELEVELAEAKDALNRLNGEENRVDL